MRTAKRVENGNVLHSWRVMKMNVNVLRGVLMDGISLPAQETKAYGYGKVINPPACGGKVVDF